MTGHISRNPDHVVVTSDSSTMRSVRTDHASDQVLRCFCELSLSRAARSGA